MNTVAFPHFPKISPNPFFRCLQVTFWIIFRPSVWLNQIQEIRTNLSPNFCVAELEPHERRAPITRQLVFTPLFFWPFFVFLISFGMGVLNQWGFQGNFPILVFYHSLLSALAAFSTSMLMSLSVSYVGGLICGIFFGLSCVAIPNGSLLAYLAFGFSFGLAGSIMRTNLNPSQPIQLSLGRLSTILIWIALIGLNILSGFLIADKFSVPYLIRSDDLTQVIFFDPTQLLVAIHTLISFLIILSPHIHTWTKTLVMSAVIIPFATLFTYGIRVIPHNDFFLYASIGLLFGVLNTIFFGIPFTVVRVTGWQRPAIVLGCVFAGFNWVSLFVISNIGFSFNIHYLVLSLAAVFVGLSFRVWRPLLFFFFQAFFNTILLVWDRSRLPEKGSLLYLHPAFWDELNYISWPRLDQYLVFVAQHNLPLARQAMLSLVYGRQRQAVYLAHLELAAQDMERLQRIQDLNTLIAKMGNWPMVTPMNSIVQRFTRIAKDVELAENQTTVFNTRTALANVREQVIELKHYLRYSQEPNAIRFLPAINHWHSLLTTRLDELARIAENAKEIENPYVFGVPIKEYLGVFVGRSDVFNKIEQLLLAPLRPPLFLYGQRRMGKTSLLLNLAHTLPSKILPLFVDCQALSGSKNYAEILYRMVNLMRISTKKANSQDIPPLSLENMPFDSPFLAFNLWLDQFDKILEKNNRMALIIFDEFETLDDIFWYSEIIPDDFLKFLRHIIQHRQNFRILISGSHSLLEIEKWAGYLVNTQTIKLGYLQDKEARHLIETPVRDFPLIYQPAAVKNILELTRGHPALIQMLCFELVQFKNNQPLSQRYNASPEDVEACVPSALQNGVFFFQDIRTQLQIDGLHMLAMLAQLGHYGWISVDAWRKAYPNNFDPNLQKILDRDLIEPVFENGYSFQIELVRRWIEMHAQNNTLVR
jgi:hypothetical protein